MAKVKINREGCIGCAGCESAAPKLFKLSDEDGKSTLIDAPHDKKSCVKTLKKEEVDIAKEAADVCPVSVISVEEEDE